MGRGTDFKLDVITQIIEQIQAYQRQQTVHAAARDTEIHCSTNDVIVLSSGEGGGHGGTAVPGER